MAKSRGGMTRIAALFLVLLHISSAQQFGGWRFPNVMVPQQRFQIPTIDEDLLNAFSTSTKEVPKPKPDVKSLHISSEIANRYAHTTMTSRVANPANSSQEATFSVIIPETAFITGFSMEIAGQVYTAYVKEKEEAKREYADAVYRGQAAAHVHQSARDSERFSVSVNVEPQSKVTFTLTYEELLQRDLGTYRHVININPGQIVPDMKVDVHIKEMKNLTELHAKEIQSANEIDSDVGENPNAQVEWIGGNEAKVQFAADENEQRRLEKLRKAGKDGSGVAGKFVIDYDVDRDSSGGEVIVNDGYFVHFFAPKDLTPLRKHVLFVLDVSGSMSGRKMEQLQQAMLGILDELKPDDLFNIIEFSYSVTVRNLDAEVDSAVYTPYHQYYQHFVEQEQRPPTDEKTEPFPATPHYIEKAKEIIQKMTAGGGTNIYDALKTAIKIAKKGVPSEKLLAETEDSNSTVAREIPVAEKKKETPRPIIIFLTDGEPTVGETSLHKIQNAVNEFNSDPKAAIFSLAFGEGADYDFLKKVSLASHGFARHIYEAADAQVQLNNFYKHISSPLLADVKFVYPPGQVDQQTITKRKFSNLFLGSEIVIAGKVGNGFNSAQVEAVSLDGPIDFEIPVPETKHSLGPIGSLERLWAYITIRQLLDEDAIQSSTAPRYSYETDGPQLGERKATKPTPKEQALKIALKYSFVCPLTSLVVVKPNGTKSDLNTESASPGADGGHIAPMAFQQSAFYGQQPASFSGPFPNQFMHMGMAQRPAFAPSAASGQAAFFYNPTTRPAAPPMAPMPTTLNVPQSAPFDRVDSIDDSVSESSGDTGTPASWLKSLKEGDQLTITTAEGTKNLTLRTDDSEEDQPCTLEGQSGVCRNLLESRHDEKREMSLEDYASKYLCELPGGVAGICTVPENDPETTTQSATTEDPTTAQSTTEEVTTLKIETVPPTDAEDITTEILAVDETTPSESTTISS